VVDVVDGDATQSPDALRPTLRAVLATLVLGGPQSTDCSDGETRKMAHYARFSLKSGEVRTTDLGAGMAAASNSNAVLSAKCVFVLLDVLGNHNVPMLHVWTILGCVTVLVCLPLLVPRLYAGFALGTVSMAPAGYTGSWLRLTDLNIQTSRPCLKESHNNYFKADVS
jgi:hypothetical protein